MDAAALEREALQLPAADRAPLVDRLLQSLGRESFEQLDLMGNEAEKRSELMKKKHRYGGWSRSSC